MAKLGIVLGDYNNGQEDIDPGQIMRNVAEVSDYKMICLYA